MNFELMTNSETETFSTGEKIGAAACPGLVIALSGDLGAGKTAFTKGIANGLGVSDEVTSPTFNIMNIYQGRLKLVHFDVYRMEREDELDAVGFYEYAEVPDGVVVIEWAEKFPDALPSPRIDVQISRTGEFSRKIIFCYDDKFSNVIDAALR